MAHSRFGGSVMARIMACPGSVKLSEGIENKTSEYAEEGTMLHDMGATILKSWWDKEPVSTEFLKKHKALEDEQREVLTEFVNCVRGEVDVLDLDEEALTPTSMLIEHGFNIHALHPEFEGTADVVLWNDKSVRVIDLKCGRGVDVQADYDGKVNPQLAFYLLGVLASLGFKFNKAAKFATIRAPEDHLKIDDLEVLIVQPRNGGVKRRKVTWTELAVFANEIVDAAKEADTEGAKLEAGDHCRFCLAKTKCPAMREHAYEQALKDFETMPDVPDMTPDQIAVVLSKSALLELWLKAVRERAEELAIRKGETIPGFKVVERLGNRTWIDADTVVDILSNDQAVPIDELTERKVLSPAQMEKALKRHAIPIKFIDDLIERKKSLAFVPESDKRPAVRGGAARDFEDAPDFD